MSGALLQQQEQQQQPGKECVARCSTLMAALTAATIAGSRQTGKTLYLLKPCIN
jgi:hypothetical protein